jgi:hypothetical protein
VGEGGRNVISESSTNTKYNSAHETIGFGDTVRIRTTIEAERLGLVYGSNTTFVKSVQIIGGVANDRAPAIKLER